MYLFLLTNILNAKVLIDWLMSNEMKKKVNGGKWNWISFTELWNQSILWWWWRRLESTIRIDEFLIIRALRIYRQIFRFSFFNNWRRSRYLEEKKECSREHLINEVETAFGAVYCEILRDFRPSHNIMGLREDKIQSFPIISINWSFLIVWICLF